MSLDILLNIDLKGHKKGDIITISTMFDEDKMEDIPTDIYWRRRLKDAEVDNCVSINFYKVRDKYREVVEKNKKSKEMEGVKYEIKDMIIDEVAVIEDHIFDEI